MTVFPEIFWSLHEIIFICKQESARDGELSEDKFMNTPALIVTVPQSRVGPDV
jgi:hypothetical protein